MRFFSFIALLAALATPAFMTACDESGVGEKCVSPSDGGANGTQIISPALDCPQRMCLIVEGQAGNPARSTCTATCSSNGDCGGKTDKNDPTLCPSKFVCAVATVVGDFCCRKMCICQDDLTAGFNVNVDGGVETPIACESGSYSSCPNIPQ